MTPLYYPLWPSRISQPQQMGQPVRDPNFNQQQSRCNKRQADAQPSVPVSEQMH